MWSSASLPPYSYVPGGPWPHPTRSPQGHSFGHAGSKLARPAEAGDVDSAEFSSGVALFNAGYFWEAHEAWEALWHAHGRQGATADVVKALIKLAAAGVKVREDQEHGVRTHAGRAAELFESVQKTTGNRYHLGLDLAEWAARCRTVAHDPPQAHGSIDLPVIQVFGFRIEIDDGSSGAQGRFIPDL